MQQSSGSKRWCPVYQRAESERPVYKAPSARAPERPDFKLIDGKTISSADGETTAGAGADAHTTVNPPHGFGSPLHPYLSEHGSTIYSTGGPGRSPPAPLEPRVSAARAGSPAPGTLTGDPEPSHGRLTIARARQAPRPWTAPLGRQRRPRTLAPRVWDFRHVCGGPASCFLLTCRLSPDTAGAAIFSSAAVGQTRLGQRKGARGRRRAAASPLGSLGSVGPDLHKTCATTCSGWDL